ncbi:MAG: CHAP domain-containing protein [Candidatus Saccharimonadales bacterium]
MKKITRKPLQSFIVTMPRRLLLVVLSVALVVGGSFPMMRDTVLADECGSIAECQQKIAESNNMVDQLKNQAVSFQDAIDKLNGLIGNLQRQIEESTAEQNSLQQQIEAGQAKLDKQREYLGQSVKGMYVKGELTTVEMLATSKNISDFVDGETYRAAVQTKIQRTVKEITKLQNELKIKKTRVDELVAQQQAQQAQLNGARAEQAALLAYNQDQQNAYNAQIAVTQSKLDELIAAQRRANNGPLNGAYYLIRFPGPVNSFNGSSYPHRNAGFSMSTLPGCGNPDPRTGERDAYDGWGYCTRQCVSYVAWAVGASGRSIPHSLGNANNWPSNVPASYLYTSGAQVGDVLVSMSGRWGHVMYVEQVNGNSVRVSEYNQNLDGRFQSYRWVTLN